MHFPVLLAGLVGLAAAHPGASPAEHEAEILARRTALQHSKKNLNHCAAAMKARGVEARNVVRRANMAHQLSKKTKLMGRDFETVLATSHLSPEDFDLTTPEAQLFASNGSCALAPETTEGPYYVEGEYIREDITDGEPGVPLYLDIQVLDMETCEPVPEQWLEIWHCNSTGVYSGVSAGGNGNSDSDTSNLNATFHRGIQLLNEEGVAKYYTTFPGHYIGRAIHIHISLHETNATAINSNNTLYDSRSQHVGQIFFDMDLVYQVEATSPYTTNQQSLLENANDGIMAQASVDDSDPVVNYVLLGDSIEDGILGWVGFGVNTTYHRALSAAAIHYETGGVSTGGGGGPPPGGPPPF